MQRNSSKIPRIFFFLIKLIKNVDVKVGYFANWLRIHFVNTRSEQTQLLIAGYILNAISWKDTYMYIIAYLDVIPYTKGQFAVTTELQYFEGCSVYCSPSTTRGV